MRPGLFHGIEVTSLEGDGQQRESRSLLIRGIEIDHLREMRGGSGEGPVVEVRGREVAKGIHERPRFRKVPEFAGMLIEHLLSEGRIATQNGNRVQRKGERRVVRRDYAEVTERSGAEGPEAECVQGRRRSAIGVLPGGIDHRLGLPLHAEAEHAWRRVTLVEQQRNTTEHGIGFPFGPVEHLNHAVEKLSHRVFRVKRRQLRLRFVGWGHGPRLPCRPRRRTTRSMLTRRLAYVPTAPPYSRDGA